MFGYFIKIDSQDGCKNTSNRIRKSNFFIRLSNQVYLQGKKRNYYTFNNCFTWDALFLLRFFKTLVSPLSQLI